MSDTVFSMDGDAADVDALIAIASRHDALLVLDEAHAVLGPPVTAPPDADVLRVGTLSKTLGSLGGFVAGPTPYVDLVVNTARPYIFTTAPTPADTAAGLAALGVLCSPEGAALVDRLRAHVDRLRPAHPSPIIPFLCGDEDARARRGRRVARSRRARAGDPAADGRAGHVAVAGHGLGRAHRRAPRATRGRARGRVRLAPDPVIILVAGTGTDVGKTWVTAAAARAIRARDRSVRAHKPAQSFAADDIETDAHVLAAATGQRPEAVCPPARWFAVPMAPPMAAAVLGREPFTIGDLVSELPPDDADVLFVESAGGVRSPLADDGDTVTLADACAPARIVLVADAGLGTISAVRLAVDALAGHRVVVHLNRFDAGTDLHRRNRDWLATREGLEIVTDPEALATLLISVSR